MGGVRTLIESQDRLLSSAFKATADRAADLPWVSTPPIGLDNGAAIDAEIERVFFLERGVEAFQVAPAVRGQRSTGINPFFAVAITGAEHPGNPLVLRREETDVHSHGYIQGY